MCEKKHKLIVCVSACESVSSAFSFITTPKKEKNELKFEEEKNSPTNARKKKCPSSDVIWCTDKWTFFFYQISNPSLFTPSLSISSGYRVSIETTTTAATRGKTNRKFQLNDKIVWCERNYYISIENETKRTTVV